MVNGFSHPGGKHNPNKGQPAGPNIIDLMEQMNTIGRRLRVLEERYSNLDKRLQLSDQNILNTNKSMNAELRATTSEVHELKKELESIKGTIKLVIQELKLCAKQEDVKVIEKYVNLWEPVKFVTRNQVENIVREILDKEE